jgi:lipoprotein-anchoring transpeptidase ErfK/SrfK
LISGYDGVRNRTVLSLDETMTLSRRTLLSSMLAAAVPLPASANALYGDGFPINEKEAKAVEYKFQRREMDYETAEPAGTIVVDQKRRFLYHVLGGGRATRYGVSVGKSTKAWNGVVTVNRMEEWPVWYPAPYHLQVMPSLIKWKDGMPGGPDNPLGARAMYLFSGSVDTLNRIHGGAKPEWIGDRKTAGCISLLNVDVVHLYSQVQVGTRVVMLG